jgi:hypothetical protein
MRSYTDRIVTPARKLGVLIGALPSWRAFADAQRALERRKKPMIGWRENCNSELGDQRRKM